MADPFHYTAIVQELTEGLRHVLQASDWKEGVGTASVTAPIPQRQQQELGNLTAALSRVRNAFRALDARRGDIETDVRLAEQPQLRAAEELGEALERGELPTVSLHRRHGESEPGA